MVFHFKTTKKSQIENFSCVPWNCFPWKMVDLSIFSHEKWWIFPYFPMKNGGPYFPMENGGSFHIFPWKNCGSFHIFPWKIVDLSIFSRNWWEKLMKSNDNMHKQVGKTLENWRKTVMINWRNRFGKLGTADETKW